jgi:hypothetical protein
MDHHARVSASLGSVAAVAVLHARMAARMDA